MARSDAWGAPAGTLFGQSKARNSTSSPKQTLVRRLLALEPLLRRAIPVLIAIFLVMIAAARALTMFAQYDETDRTARSTLALAVGEVSATMDGHLTDSSAIDAILSDVRENGLLGQSYTLVVLDEADTIRQVNPSQPEWLGKRFDDTALGAEPLLALGEGAGVIDVSVNHADWMAALARNPTSGLTAVVMAPRSALFSEWKRTVKLNITLFIVTAGVLLIVLYAYHSQSARVQAGERSYIEAYQRIDLALVRGRCGLWDWDMARGRMYWSRSMYDMLGYQASDAVLSFGDVDALIHPSDQDLFAVAQRIAARETDHIDQVFRMRHADSTWVWVRARAQVVDPEAPELHLIGIALDVTEQRQLALRSETADMRLGAAVESISESFVLWDANGRLVMCNDRFRADLGLSENDIAPGTPRHVIEGRRLPFIADRRLANANGARGGASHERQLSDGRWLQVTELRTTDGGLVSVGSDITQLKQHQERLTDSERRLMATVHDLQFARKAEAERSQQLERETERAEAASRAKSEFLANMSHELRTPLNAIIGFSEIMASGHFGPLGNDRYAEYANDIHDSGEHLLGVINDILDMAKIESGQFQVKKEEIDLGPLITETARVITVQATNKSIDLETRIGQSMRVFADRRSIKQIVINLLSNAVKFTGNGGKITVRARQISGALVLSIEDNGCGIPKSALKKLGRPFEQVQNQFSKNHKGSGLGLAISRSLAEMNGGSLKIRSKEGKGTIVSVRIPARKAERTEKTEKKAA